MMDPLYGKFTLTALAKKVTQNVLFKRLQAVNQMGTVQVCHPAAAQATRWQHCLGTWYLARYAVQSLQKRQPELKITDRVVELVALAGQLHDVGHGPFSHVWDSLIGPMSQHAHPHPHHHEDRSVDVVEKLHSLLKLQKEETQFVKEIIRGTPRLATLSPLSKQYPFCLDIVNNQNSCLDVDKLDYLPRDHWHLFHQQLIPTEQVFNLLEGWHVIQGQLHFCKHSLPLISRLLQTREHTFTHVYNGPSTLVTDVLLAMAIAQHPTHGRVCWTSTDAQLSQFLPTKAKVQHVLKTLREQPWTSGPILEHNGTSRQVIIRTVVKRWSHGDVSQCPIHQDGVKMTAVPPFFQRQNSSIRRRQFTFTLPRL